ncbi:unnamed protein product [Sphagnum troendelagicum]|uniref:PTC1-like winged helix-turn-helix domain-containing protein n=1 Tax=Sphagnum troendelagicum TaxID=128251 RepID=A0ABP0UY66_9BRYO
MTSEPRQIKRRHMDQSTSTSPRKLLKGVGGEKRASCNNRAQRDDSLLEKEEEEEIQLECTEAIGDILSASTGSTYHEIDQRRLPPEAPLDLKNVRAVQIADKTRLQTTVNYPTAISLKKWFGESTHSALDNIHCNTPAPMRSYTSPEDSMEPLMGTKPALDGTFTMSSKLADEVLLRSISSTEYLHQGHLKTFWIVGPDSTQSSESNFKEGTADRMATQLSDRRSGHGMGITVDHRSRNSDLLHTAAGRSVSSDHRIGHQEQIRYPEMMKDNDLLHSPAFTFMQPCNRSFGGAGASSVPMMNHPVGNIRATAAGSASGAMKRAMASNAPRDHIPKEKTNKLQPGSAKGSVNILKLPKDMQGRWSCERYKSAQFKLIDIMHERGVAPGRPILRPALREEARKHIGDTGLLDHLLKHMTDTVVHTGERFRRRHNSEGAMEYWLEHASLMDMRKAAGIEDPSWVPPPDWMPGDRLPGKPWELINGGQSSCPSPTVAAGIMKLNDSVQSLSREMKALLGRLEGYREICPNSTPQNTSLKMDPTSSTLGGLLHENGFQGARHATENEIAISNDNIEDQSLQEEMHLETGFFKRSLEAQLVDLRHAVTTIQVRSLETFPITGTGLTERDSITTVLQGDLRRVSNILGIPAASECPGTSEEPNLSRHSTGDETCIAPTVVMSEHLTPAACTSSICRLPVAGAADNVSCLRQCCRSMSTDGIVPIPAVEPNQSHCTATVVANQPAQIAGNTTLPMNSTESLVLPFPAGASRTISGNTVFCNPPANFIWPSSGHYIALNQLQNYGSSVISAMHTLPAVAASPSTSMNWQQNTPAETAYSAGRSGCMRQQSSNGLAIHHHQISAAAANVSTHNPHVLLPFPLELSMNRSEQDTCMYVQSDNNPAHLVVQQQQPSFYQPQQLKSEQTDFANNGHVMTKPIRPLPCPVIRSPMRSSPYSVEPPVPVSAGWLGVGLHPSSSMTYHSDPHHGSASSRLKKSSLIMHQQQLQTNMVAAAAAGDRMLISSSLPPYPCMSLVDTQTIDSAIRDHCQLLMDRNRAAAAAQESAAGRDSTPSSSGPAAANTSSSFVVQSPVVAALARAAPTPGDERSTTTPDPPTLSLSLSLSLGPS